MEDKFLQEDLEVEERSRRHRGHAEKKLDRIQVRMHPAILRDVMQQMRKEEPALQVQRGTKDTTM